MHPQITAPAFEFRRAESARRPSVLETYRPTEKYESVAAIGVDHINHLIGSGRTLFISDIDGTAVANGSFDVSPETAEVYSAISNHPHAKLVFWTNISGKTENEILRMQWIAKSQGAEFVTFRDAPDETKPSPAKIHAIIAKINESKEPGETPITTANSVMIGDKLTADIRAGNFARDDDPTVAAVHTIKVDRLGGPFTDLYGDRYLRRPYERLLWNLLGKKSGADIASTSVGEVVEVQGIPIKEPKKYYREKLPTKTTKVTSEVLINHSLVASVGNGPELALSGEKFATMPPPRIEPIYAALRKLQKNAIIDIIEARAMEHGKEDANVVTLARILGIPLVIGAVVLDKPKLATGLYVCITATDVIDGFLAGIYRRYHPEEYIEVGSEEITVPREEDINEHQATKQQDGVSGELNSKFTEQLAEWGWDTGVAVSENIKSMSAKLREAMKDPEWGPKWDPLADKILANSAEAVLTMKELAIFPPVALIIIRDFLKERHQRPKYRELGFTAEDLKSTRSSKNSSFILNLAIAVTIPATSAKTKVVVQTVAAAGKWFSHFGSVPIWKRRKQFREDAAEKHTLLKEIYGLNPSDLQGLEI